MNISQWLAGARHAGVARLDAQLLLAHHLGCERTWLIAHDDAPVPAPVRARADADLARRAAGVPLAQLLGVREFFGLPLRVTADVLIPRPETEGLVAWALELAPHAPCKRLVDLGTGSGAIALAFKHAAAGYEVHASDASAAALAVARENGRRLQLQVHWHEGDWWQPFEGRAPFGLAVANPPYIAEGDAHLAALRHEPPQALTAGADGLAALDTIVAAAPAHLALGAWLLLEHGFDQGEAVRGLLRRRGFAEISTRPDLAGLARCSGGRWQGG